MASIYEISLGMKGTANMINPNDEYQVTSGVIIGGHTNWYQDLKLVHNKMYTSWHKSLFFFFKSKSI